MFVGASVAIRYPLLPWFVGWAMVACSEPDTVSSPGSAGAGGSSQTAGESTGGRADEPSAGESSVGGASELPSGGAAGLGGQMPAGGSTGVGGAGDCVLPPQAPVSGSECPAACEGKVFAYEDCDGAGLVQAGCATDWFVFEAACGDHLCQDPVFNGETCGTGMVCALMQGGAQIPQCSAHDCGTGPITCDCLGAACPGCVQTGVLDFTCNTCPSGQCP
jgi:hypothetical protein